MSWVCLWSVLTTFLDHAQLLFACHKIRQEQRLLGDFTNTQVCRSLPLLSRNYVLVSNLKAINSLFLREMIAKLEGTQKIFMRVWMGGSGIHYSLKNYPIIHLIKILGFSLK